MHFPPAVDGGIIFLYVLNEAYFCFERNYRQTMTLKVNEEKSIAFKAVSMNIEEFCCGNFSQLQLLAG
jgi:hypothetical protein